MLGSQQILKNSIPTGKNMSGRNEPIRIGIDIGGSDVKFGATNSTAEKLLLDELVKRPSLATEGPTKTIAQVIDGIQAVLAELNADWSDVIDISVTVPCPCTSEGAIVEATNLGPPETKELWKLSFGELLAEEVQKLSGREIPVFACNDANAAAQDDDFVRYGSSKEFRTSVFVTTGTGLGGCVMIQWKCSFWYWPSGRVGPCQTKYSGSVR